MKYYLFSNPYKDSKSRKLEVLLTREIPNWEDHIECIDITHDTLTFNQLSIIIDLKICNYPVLCSVREVFTGGIKNQIKKAKKICT